MKFSMILLSLAFSSSLFAGTQASIRVNLNGAYNDQDVITDLTKTIYVSENYQSTCYQTVPGPGRTHCTTIERTFCNDRNDRDDRRHREHDHRSSSSQCRKETVQTCEKIPTTIQVPYSCTKTQTVAQRISDGQFLLRTSVNIVNPEAIKIANCNLTGFLDQREISNLDLSCGDRVLEVLSKRIRTISDRESHLVIDAKIVSRSELIRAVNGRLQELALIDNKFSFVTGKIDELSMSNLEFDLYIKQDKLFLDKKTDLQNITHSAISVEQLENNKSRVSIDLTKLNVEIKKNKKYSILPIVKLRLTRDYIGISNTDLSTGGGVFTLGK